MGIYKLGNIFTHERAEIEAKSFDAACAQLGWLPGECWGRIFLEEFNAMKKSSQIKE